MDGTCGWRVSKAVLKVGASKVRVLEVRVLAVRVFVVPMSQIFIQRAAESHSVFFQALMRVSEVN